MLDTLCLLFIIIRWLDVVDILLVSIIMYQVYKLVKGTVAIKIFFGVLAIYLFWKLPERAMEKSYSCYFPHKDGK